MLDLNLSLHLNDCRQNQQHNSEHSVHNTAITAAIRFEGAKRIVCGVTRLIFFNKLGLSGAVEPEGVGANNLGCSPLLNIFRLLYFLFLILCDPTDSSSQNFK
jgi:hypothetical protein